MKRILTVVIAAVAALTLCSSCGLCGSCGPSGANTQQASPDSEPKDRVEVLYFHSKKRCVTCNAIERLSGEMLKRDFAQQIQRGEVVFKVIDISTEQGQQIADKYEVTWSSLFVNKWKEGQEYRNDMTKLGFSHAKNSPEVFQKRLKVVVEGCLK